MKVTLLIPAYNEKDNVRILFETIDKFIKSNKLEWEVVFIDDGSVDGTFDEVKLVADKYPYVKLVRHSINKGVTEALMSGAKVASNDILVFFPADLQYSLDDVFKMVEKIENEGYDLVTGWKVGNYEKKFVSNVYNWLSRKLFNLPVHDLNSIKVFKKKLIFEIPMRRDWHRYIVPLAYNRGFKITEIKVRLYPRKYGSSKFKGLSRILIGFFDLLSVKFQMSFTRKPMLFFGTLGLLSLFLGLITGLIALYLRYIKGIGFRPLLYLVILLILAGLILFISGFLGELIAGLHDRLERLEESLKKKD
jgi:glycosyltransferase involved in cell wall biosynthesis